MEYTLINVKHSPVEVTICNDTQFADLLEEHMGYDTAKFYRDRINELEEHISKIRRFRPTVEFDIHRPYASRAEYYRQLEKIDIQDLKYIAEEALQIRGEDE